MATPGQKGPVQPLERVWYGCSEIRTYEMLGKLGEGTFGEVHKATHRRTGAVVALKKILMHNEKDGFPITALREIKLLKQLSHINILTLTEMAVERPKGEGRKKAILYMVTPYMHHDLSGLLDNPDVQFTVPQIKCYLLQLLEGLRYLHDSSILHRDMKAANLLINNKGILQIADFGLARHYEGPVPQPGRGCGDALRDYTALVVTRWYRPPELLLSLRRYTPAIDMWGAGCVFGEMFKRKPILTGKSDLDQAHLIFDLVGSPTDQNMPGWNDLPGCEGVKQFAPRTGMLAQQFREVGPTGIDLLSKLLRLDWRKRVNAFDALQHPYFKEHPLPARPEELPRFEDSHELDRRRPGGQGKRPALPPAPHGGTVGGRPNGEWANGSGPPVGNGWNGDSQSTMRGGRGYPDRGPPNGGSSQQLPYSNQQSQRGYENGRGPPPGHNHNRGPPGPPGAGRRPGWEQNQAPPPGLAPPSNLRHPLPAAPPPLADGLGHRQGEYRDRDRGDRGGRDRPDRADHGNRDRERGGDRGGRQKADVDTYIPSYAGGREPHGRRGSRESINSRDSREWRDDRDRGRYREHDRRSREPEWERGPPGGLNYDGARDRRTRSRSPDRQDRRGDRERDYRR